MTDITHNHDTIPRLRRILDEGPALPERASDHETPPAITPPEKKGSAKIAEQAIGPLRQTGQYVLDQFKPMHDRLDQAEQMVIKAMADVEANIHAQMRIMDAAAKIIQQTDQQLKEAMEPLDALTNGK